MANAPHRRLIVNGKSAGAPGLREAVHACRRDGQRLDVRVTWERGDGERYVDEAIADGIDCVIAGGGDGTLGEIAGALAAQAEQGAAIPHIAVLPLGTANDFATAAGIPAMLDAAFTLALSGTARPADILRVQAGSRMRWCMNVATGGFGTQATTDMNDGLKKYLGGLSYLLGGVAAICRAQPQEVELRGPGFRWTGPMIALGIGNARQAGGGQALCPDALIDDGLLDVTVVGELSGELAGTMATAIADGKQAALDQVAERARLPWLEVLSTQPLTLNLDGEPLEGERFRIDCLAHRLQLVLPPGCLLLEDPAVIAPMASRAP